MDIFFYLQLTQFSPLAIHLCWWTINLMSESGQEATELCGLQSKTCLSNCLILKFELSSFKNQTLITTNVQPETNTL